LTGDSGEVIEAYSYDGYGMMLGGNPSRANPSATPLLYTGEQFDNDAQQYYLRARYYDTSTGRFNRMDTYPGSPQDPQSLHKYLYANCNPINAIDPSGQCSLVEFVTTHAIHITLGYIGLNLLYNIGSHITADLISKNHYEPSGRWITSAAGLAFGFGPSGGVFGLITARGTSTGQAIVGVFGGGGLVFPASMVTDGIQYLIDHSSDLAATITASWNADPIDNGVRVVNNILAGFKTFSKQFGGQWKQANLCAGLLGGNGVVFNAPYADDVVGLSVGGGASYQGVNVGVFGEAFRGLSLSEGLTGVISVGGGLTLSFATTPAGAIMVGVSVFVPTNMKDWGLADI